MTIDKTQPTDDEYIKNLPAFIRETRDYMNSYVGGITIFDAELTPLDKIIPTVPDNINIIVVTATLPLTLTTIQDASIGDVVYLFFGDDNIEVKDKSSISPSTYNIDLNGDPNAPDFPPIKDDVLVLMFTGDVWQETRRILFHDA